MPGISVIVATYNRSHLLRGLLEALARQEDPGVPVTVIVADNGSTDDTRATFETMAPKRPEFEWRYVREPRAGKSYAVNRALEHVRGEWLAFTDDDVRPDPGWLAAIARAFERSAPDFVVGRILPIWETPPPAWLTPALYGVLGVPDNGPLPSPVAEDCNEHLMPIGTNMAVHREVMRRAAGLRPDLGKMRGTLRTGEDHEFYLRLLHAGCVGAYVPDALVHHLVPAQRLSRRYFRRWHYQNGRNVATLESSYPPRGPMLLGVPRYKWRKAATDGLRLLVSAARFDPAERFQRSVALLWFAGYIRERWFGPAVASAATERSSVSSRSSLGVRA